jgi:hypothetical protein
MRIKSIILSLLFLLNIETLYAQQAVSLSNCIFQPEDRRIAEEKLKTFSTKSHLSIAELIPEIGYSFLRAPYVGATLENGMEEKLVINLRQFDCTTFTESCLALARTVKSGKTDFESYISELEHIRYRDGIRNQYLSRIHYFSEWIRNNAEKKIVSEEPNLKGEKFKRTIRFMSSHPESYPVLKAHPELIPTLIIQESKISDMDFYYFPKSNPNQLLGNLKHGDIIGLTSSTEGIDINHVGIIVWKDDQFHLLHAGQSAKMVVISEGPITDFIKPESKNTGIMIARPEF